MSELKQIKSHHERQLKNMDKKLTMYQIHPDDVSWLIKQAERVEELEEKVKQYEKALAGFNKEFNFEYRWQKSNVKHNPKSQWQRGALEGFEHVKRIYDKHVEVQND